MEIFWSQKLKLPNELKFQRFVQDCANRLMQGYCRYGGPNRSQCYLTKLEMELKAYIKTGNSEHLRNLSNYAHLEDCEPENPLYYNDNTVKSVTRHKIRT